MAVASGSNHLTFHSKSQLVELSATWTIENAHLRLNPLPRMKSPPIYSADRSQKWHMWIDSVSIDGYIGVVSPSSTTYVDAYMTVESADVVRAEYVISVVDAKGAKVELRNSPCSEFTSRTSRGEDSVRFPVQDLTTNDEWLPNDKLTLFCQVKAIAMASKRTKVRFSLPDIYLNKLSMLDDKKFTDVVLVVEKRELKAHKAMLAAHSSVFEAMFNSDMTESSQNRVEITDLDYDVVEQMLQFIYTDKAPKLNQMADRLLAAADKYDLERLKIICEQALCGNLSVDNAVMMLALANRHDADHLASHANEIIASNIAEVMLTEDWHDMVAKFSQTIVLSGDEALLEKQKK